MMPGLILLLLHHGLLVSLLLLIRPILNEGTLLHVGQLVGSLSIELHGVDQIEAGIVVIARLVILIIAERICRIVVDGFGAFKVELVLRRTGGGGSHLSAGILSSSLAIQKVLHNSLV